MNRFVPTRTTHVENTSTTRDRISSFHTRTQAHKIERVRDEIENKQLGYYDIYIYIYHFSTKYINSLSLSHTRRLRGLLLAAATFVE